MKYSEENFKNELDKLYNNELEIVGRYKSINSPILLKDKYGVMSLPHAKQALLNRPGIKAALNKTEYFMNQLKEVHPEIYNEIEPLSEYKKMKEKMLFNTKFGLISINPDSLIHGHIPTIRTAVNRKEYFKNQLLYIYENKYDFEILSTDRHEGRVNLICPIHGVLSVDNDNIFTGCGCPKCNKDWVGSDLFYLIKLSNDTENFYKLGISHRLRNGKISRFASYKNLGYNIEVLKIIEFKNAIDCKDFELSLKQLIKNNLYVPKILDYNTSTETFSDNLLESIINQINNIKYDIVSTSTEMLSSPIWTNEK